MKLRGITLLLEERLLFKILQWAGVGQAPQEAEAKEEEVMNLLTRQTVSPSNSETNSRQLYLEDLKVSDVELRVSVFTTSQLPDDLKRIKRYLGFPLIQFERPIYLDEFHQSHILGNPATLLDAFQKHYKSVSTLSSIFASFIFWSVPTPYPPPPFSPLPSPSNLHTYTYSLFPNITASVTVSSLCYLSP